MLKKVFSNYMFIFALIISVGVTIGYGLYYDLKSQQAVKTVEKKQSQESKEVAALQGAWGEIKGNPVIIKSTYENQPPVYIYKIVEKETGKIFVISVAKGNTPISILEAK
jgi:hypothetical protein